MRKLFFVLPALAALSLLVPSSGFAQANNQVGLYFDQNDLTTTSVTTGSGYLSLHVVLSYPYLEDPYHVAPGPVAAIAGFELRLGYPDGETWLPFDGDGDGKNYAAYPDVIYGFLVPQLVVDNHCYLGYFTQVTSGGDDLGYYLTPLGTGPSGDTDDMFFAVEVADQIEELQAMFPSSGSHSEPVFVVNGTPVDAQSETWGGVKSLYR